MEKGRKKADDRQECEVMEVNLAIRLISSDYADIPPQMSAVKWVLKIEKKLRVARADLSKIHNVMDKYDEFIDIVIRAHSRASLLDRIT